MADLSKISTADLEAMSQGKLSAVSDDGIQLLHDAASAGNTPAPKPSYLSQAVKGTIDSLPMLGGIAGGILGTPADAITGPAGNMAGAAIGGYLGTAAKNLANRYYDPKSAPQTTTQAVTGPLVGGGEQGLMQGVGEAAAPVIGKALSAAADTGSSAAKWMGTKFLSSLGGVKPAVIQEYAQYADRINSAPSVDALKEVSDQFVGKLASDVDAKKLTAEQAQDALKGFHSDLKDAYKTAGYDARDAVTSAQQSLKDAHNSRLQQMSGDIYDTVNKLKSDIQAGSGQALKTLDKSNAMVDLAPTYTQIDNTIAGLQKKGTDESLAVADKLQAYKDRQMAKYGAKVPGSDAKALIQGLDQITEYNPMAGSFDKAKNAAFKDIRGTLDETLKNTVSEYRKAMEPVAANSDLLGRVSGFGDKQSAVGLLQRINAPNQLENRAALQELGQKYGTDFIAGAQPENLPEHGLLQKAQAAQDALRPDRVAEKVDQSVAASRQKAAFDAAQSDLGQAQDRLAPFKSLAPNGAGQTQAQQKLTQLGKGGNIELTDMFHRLGKLTDTDFVQAMKDRNVLAAFEKGATNGSRNTLMGSLVGSALGFGLGGGWGAVEGSAVGGSLGRVVDQWGPAITKRVLDGAIRVSESPTAATISSLSLPDPIKRNMIVGLENYLSQGQAEQSALQRVAQSQDSQNRAPAKGPDAWAQAGLGRLGITDQTQAAQLLRDPKARALLIQASDLTPGSRAMNQIMTRLQTLGGSR